jgi:hypothetical protein
MPKSLRPGFGKSWKLAVSEGESVSRTAEREGIKETHGDRVEDHISKMTRLQA